MDSINEILKLLQKHWHSKFGLFLSLILSFIITFTFLSQFAFSESYLFVIYSVTFICVILFWFYGNTIPRVTENKVGFVISIATYGDKEKSKIKEDFIITLTQLIKSGRAGKSFEDVQRYHTKN